MAEFIPEIVLDSFRKDRVRPFGDDRDEVFTGKGRSLHSRNSETGQTTPMVRGAKEFDMLGAANAVLGAANLGLGVYNAYQIHQAQDEIQDQAVETRREIRRSQAEVERQAEETRREIREVKDALAQGFGEVKRTLEYQNGLLHAIEEVQETHGRKLDTILRGLLEGFDSIEERIEEVTQKRRNDAFLQRLSGLHLAKEEVAEDLHFDGKASDSSVEKLAERADDLKSWLDGRLRSDDLHPLARQPVKLAETEAEMARVDALMFDDADQHRDRARYRIDNIREEIRDEVERLHRDASPWEIATLLRGQVRNYATLHRSLGTSSELLEPGTDLEVELEGDSTQLPSQQSGRISEQEDGNFESPPWDDGLPPSPELEPDDSLDSFFELRTAADYEWLVDAFELDPNEVDVHELTYLTRRAVEQRLGADELPADFEDLRPWLDPDPWDRYLSHIESEFGFKPDVSLNEVNPQGDSTGLNREAGSTENRNLSDLGAKGVSAPRFGQNTVATYYAIIELEGRNFVLEIRLDEREADIRMQDREGGRSRTNGSVKNGWLEFENKLPGSDESRSFKWQSKSETIKFGSDPPPWKYLEVDGVWKIEEASPRSSLLPTLVQRMFRTNPGLEQ